MPHENFSIICDDIRLEEGNKISLMGVYTDGVLVPEFPFVMAKLCFFQELEDAEGIQNLLVHLRGPKLSIKAALQVTRTDKKIIRVRVGFGPVTFEEEADYRFDTYIDESIEPTVTKSFFVRLREDLKIT